MGDNSTSSTSRPLTAEERAQLYNKFLDSAGWDFNNGRNFQEDAPVYDPGEAKTMTNGDYNRLEQNIVESRMAPIDRAMQLERQRTDSDVAKRGLFSSGIGLKAQNDVTERFAPSIAQAGADAATQRYGAQQKEIGDLNQYNMGRNTMLNTVAGQRVDARRNAAWRPAEYLQGVWNGTGGVVSSGTGGGWSI